MNMTNRGRGRPNRRRGFDDDFAYDRAPPVEMPRSAATPHSWPSSAGYGPEHDASVKWFNPDKGFGFVAPVEGGKDVFVHATALQRAGVMQLAEGQTIWMEVVQGAKGPEASSIRVDD